jgi:TolB protein
MFAEILRREHAMKRFMFVVAAILLLPALSIQAQTPEQAPILFWSDRDGDFDIYLMDGTGAVNLTQNDAGDAWGTWSPDGRMIAFESDRDGHRKIYVMNADGSDARSFTDADARDPGPAVWSPEGDRLAFMSWLPTDEDATNLAYLVVVNVASGEVQQLTPGLDPNFIANSLSWSPDGTQLVLEGPGEQDPIQDIYRVTIESGEFVNLTQQEADGDVWPAFSPDGSQIVFASERDRGMDIFVMDADGSDPRNLTNTLERYELRPVWSPDGAQIAFVSVSLQDPQDQDIYVMNADGSDLRVLAVSGEEDFPTWSPDGRQIAYYTLGDEGQLDIGVIDVESGEVVLLTDDAASDYFPQWKPIP